MHVARVFEVESCGLRIDLFSFTWFWVSMFAAVNPWCVSDFFCVCSHLLVARCCSACARFVGWRPFVAARSQDPHQTTHPPPATGRPPRDLLPVPFCPVSKVLEPVNVNKRWHLFKHGIRLIRSERLAAVRCHGSQFVAQRIVGYDGAEV